MRLYTTIVGFVLFLSNNHYGLDALSLTSSIHVKPFSYNQLLTTVFVLTTTITITTSANADNPTRTTVNGQEQVQHVQEQQCNVMADGTCVVDNNNNSSNNNTDTSILDLPPIPEFDDDGFVETGYGEKQQIIVGGEDATKKASDRLVEMHQYMHGVVYKKEPSTLKEDCMNRHVSCTFWASIGECDANPAYMTIQCAPACYTCHKLLFESRCPMPTDLDATNIWKNDSNDLNKMFENIITNQYYKEMYNNSINVLLRPGMRPNNKFTSYTDSPWVVVIDNFLTDMECDTLIQLGADRGYEISKDVGKRLFDGSYDAKQSTGRTSTNAWCLDACFNNTVTQNVLERIVNLTGIPDTNSEYLQLLKYDVGQFYEIHHDYIEHHVNREQGVRILTVFLYLNDVEEGGGTDFPILNITVMPKRGRVLIWPSVKDENPSVKDPRTDHQALPVVKGIKYGANAWLHLRDFKTPYSKSCI